MVIERINSSVLSLPPNWLSRVGSRSANYPQSNEIKKMLGEPIPQVIDFAMLTPEIAAFFRKRGLLERIRKKLSIISKKKGGKIFAAKGVVASVDEDDNIYVGVEFLERFGDDEELIAGILAHEWGHIISDKRKIDWTHLTWEELYEMRRTEEAEADGFAGRALYLMGYTYKSVVDFLKALKMKKKKYDLPDVKYHNTATRIEIFKEAWKAQRQSESDARKIFDSTKPTSVKIGRVIGEG